MPVCTTTTARQLQSSFIRLDAEFFRPEYIEESSQINSIPGISRLGRVAERITQGSNPTFVKNGLPCVNGKNVYFGTMEEGEPNYVSPAEFQRLSGYILKRNDLVITLKHATKVGRVWIIEDDKPRIFSRNVGLIRLRGDSPIRHSVLLLYLWTRTGQLLIDRCATGGTTGQITLPMSELRRLPIPPVSEDHQIEIDTLFRQSRTAARSAATSYEEAQQLLEAELGLNKLTFQKPVGYIARLSEATASGRIDADHFQPQYATVRSLVKSYSGGCEPLLACCDSQKPNIDPSKTPKQVFSYIELSNINSSIGAVEGALTGCGNELPSRAKRQVKTGDVIASAVVGSIDKVAIITNEQDGFIASSGFFHLRPRTVSAEYLLMLVRSKCVQMQFQQQATGGILSAVPDSRLKHVLVPKLADAVKEQITELVMQSHEAKRQSDNLLEQAKTRVEQLIEEAVQS